MSPITDEILEKLKTLSLLEAAELVSRIEEVFGVDASVQKRGGRLVINNADSATAERVEKKTFDVVLESVSENQRVAALKAIRSLTTLGLKEAKDFCSSLPKVVKEGVSKEVAETVKKDLENAGGKAVIK
jgi:large subunit ribosomal protein L7/L12